MVVAVCFGLRMRSSTGIEDGGSGEFEVVEVGFLRKRSAGGRQVASQKPR